MDRDLQVALDQMLNVIRVGQARGWPLPDGYDENSALARAATALINAPAPVNPPLPKKATEIPAWVSKVAAARRDWSDSRAVAEELHEIAQRGLGRAGQSAVSQYIGLCVAAFDELAADFTRLVRSAPPTLTGHENAQQLADHSQLLRTSAALTRCVADRGTLAVASGEGATLGPQGIAWLYLKPAASASLEAIETALRTITVPTTIDDWATMHSIGLGAAREDEAAHRMTQFMKARHQRGQQPHGGMHDEQWGDMTAPVAA
jgi:hypothetical protein